MNGISILPFFLYFYRNNLKYVKWLEKYITINKNLNNIKLILNIINAKCIRIGKSKKPILTLLRLLILNDNFYKYDELIKISYA